MPSLSIARGSSHLEVLRDDLLGLCEKPFQHRIVHRQVLADVVGKHTSTAGAT